METAIRDQNTALRQKVQMFSQFVTNWLAGSKHKNQIPVLDGVRAVACLAVLSYHLNVSARSYDIWPAIHSINMLIAIPAYFGESLAFFGDSGVILFFILSSFLLFLPYARALLFDSPWPSLRRFYLRRIFRILPGYYAALFLIALLFHRDFLYPSHWHDLWLFLTFQMNFTLSQQLNGPFWTLAIEFQFYLLLPMIAWLFSLIVRRGSLRWRLFKLTLCLLILMGWGLFTRSLGLSTTNTPKQHSSLFYHIFTVLKPYIYGTGNDIYSGKFFEVFAVGMLICMIYTYTQYASSMEYWDIRIRRFSPLLFTIGLFLLISLSIYHSIIYDFSAYNLIFISINSYSDIIMSYWLNWQSLGYAISYGFCLLALLYGSSRLKRPFEWTVLRWIGLISFSLYLWHLPIMFSIVDNINNITHQRVSGSLVAYTVFCCGTLVVVLPVSVIVYRWIEMLGIRIGERLIQRLNDRSKREIMETKQKHLGRYLQDAIVLLLLGGLLFYGSFWEMFDTESSDPALYQCYAVAFWQGWSGLEKLPFQVGSPTPRCSLITNPSKDLTNISQNELVDTMQQWRLPSSLIQFVAAQSSNQPYHTLPREYPASALLVFSLGLIAPAHWYGVAYAIWMILLIGCVYLVLLRWRSRQAALAYSLYLVVGGWATAASRFDLIPAALTLFALVCTAKKHWNWAFALLALATLMKLYPVILLIPFFLALQRETQGQWYIWRRWLPVAVFVGICVLGTSISLLLSVAETLAPLEFFSNRPVLVESLSASLLWILSLSGKTSLMYIGSFGTSNVLSSLSSNIICLMNILLVIGLLSTWYLQWQGRMDLATTCLLTLLMVITTAKVFSPQYLIWVIPLAAYAGQSNPRWLVSWTLIGLLTTWIYPAMYRTSWAQQLGVADLPLFYPVSLGRNCLFLDFIVFVLISKLHLSHSASQDKKQVKHHSMVKKTVSAKGPSY